MPRSKVKLELIADETARRTSFRKRKPSLMKKLHEIHTLCDVEASAIMHSPYDDQLVLWPDHNGVQSAVDRFMSIPDMEQNKKMLNRDNYIKKKISKAEKQLEKQNRGNQLKQITKVRSDCLAEEGLLATLDLKDLKDLVSLSNDNISEIDAILELRESGVLPVTVAAEVSVAAIVAEGDGETEADTEVDVESETESDTDTEAPPQAQVQKQQVVNTTENVGAEMAVDGYVPVGNESALDGGAAVYDYEPFVESLEDLDGGLAPISHEAFVENHGLVLDGGVGGYGGALDGGVSVEDYIGPQNPVGGGCIAAIETHGPSDGLNNSTEWIPDWIANMDEHVTMSFADDPNSSGSGAAPK